jgi:hypothetical protein
MSLNRTLALILPAWLCAVPPALAGDAHVHGEARLAVAVDGPTLTLMLESPADNLLGFEHAPRNDSERAAVTQLKETLNRPAELFVPTPEAGCAPSGTKLASALFAAGYPHGHDAHGAEHTDVEAEYVFHCARPGELAGLDVRLFERFEGLGKLKAEVVGPGGQKAATLSPRQRLLSW